MAQSESEQSMALKVMNKVLLGGGGGSRNNQKDLRQRRDEKRFEKDA